MADRGQNITLAVSPLPLWLNEKYAGKVVAIGVGADGSPRVVETAGSMEDLLILVGERRGLTLFHVPPLRDGYYTANHNPTSSSIPEVESISFGSMAG